jgi:hypothetical protein
MPDTQGRTLVPDEAAWNSIRDRLSAMLDRLHQNERTDAITTLYVAVTSVLELHRPFRIYDECGHKHTAEDVEAGRAIDVTDVGYTCSEGLMYVICRECCADDRYQTEDCATNHDHGVVSGCWPCPTLRRITNALDADLAPTPAKEGEN